MNKNWRVVIDAEPRDGAMNMALDEILMKRQSSGDSPPTIRFYQWKPVAISIGQFQNIDSINLQRCNEKDVDVIRRITGGRAILHKNDVTYSVIAPESDLRVSGRLMDTYKKISNALLEGLKLLGVQAELSSGERGAGNGSTVCFNSTARYELTALGRKLIGSAQCRRFGAVLQHGSLPLVNEIDFFLNLLRFSSKEKCERARNLHTKKATSLDMVFGRHKDFTTVSSALLSGMLTAFEMVVDISPFTNDELAHAEFIRRTKYATDNWNLFGKAE